MVDEYLTSKNCHDCARRDYDKLESGYSDSTYVQKTMVPMHYPNQPPVRKKKKKKRKRKKISTTARTSLNVNTQENVSIK